MKNKELARRVVDYARTHPDEHEQMDYGHRHNGRTTYCLVGLTVFLGDPDYQWKWNKIHKDCYMINNGHEEVLTQRAEELLGIGENDSHYFAFEIAKENAIRNFCQVMGLDYE